MGLLLGLVIVVVIAFLINGLPGLISSSASETPVNTSIVKFTPDDTGINEKAARAVSAICVIQEAKAQPIINEPVRFKAPLPVKKTIKLAPKPTRDRKTGVEMGKKYLVKDGDNLGSIAKEIYGEELGNKHVAVKSIYNANRSLLSSPDDLKIGQQLIIPVVAYTCGPMVDKGSEEHRRMTETMTVRMKKFTEKNIKAFKKAVGSGKREYIVQPGDSLWLIAKKTLADGSRYNEILIANSRTIDDEESISVGMRLKIPTD